MPSKPQRPCAEPGCPYLVDAGRCPEHRKQHQRQWDDRRGSSSARGYGAQWQRARAAWLHGSPLCAECLRNNRITSAVLVDHITPHKGDMVLFWDKSNWQSLCDACHNHKRGLESAEARKSIA